MAERKDKKEHHEFEHKKEEHHVQKDSNMTLYIILAIIVLAVIIFVYIKYYSPSSAGNNAKTVIASVNGEEITLDELEKAYQSVPSQSQISLTKKDLLNQMIEARVIYQEAKKQGFEISNETAKQQLEFAKKASGLTEEQFQQFLIQQNLTKESLITQIKKQATVQTFLNETIYSQIEIPEQEIKDYYNKNKDKFKVQEQVTVRHILIGNESLTDEQKNETAQKILKEANEKNFCDYVKSYSTDIGSIDKCGEYVFGKDDPLVQEFKNLSFSQSSGKIGIVKTIYGYHIIWTVKKTPDRTLTYTEVKSQIKTLLVGQKAQEAYKKYYEELLGKNVIRITYNEETKK